MDTEQIVIMKCEPEEEDSFDYLSIQPKKEVDDVSESCLEAPTEPVETMSTEDDPLATNNGLDKDSYLRRLKSYYGELNKGSKKMPWTSERVDTVIGLLEAYDQSKSQSRKRTSTQYFYHKRYEVIESSGKKILIVKRESKLSPIVQVVPMEQYYDYISHYHISSAHGGRDKIIRALKNKYVIPIPAIMVYLNACRLCSGKRGVVKRIAPNSANGRGHIEILDFQSMPDDDFKWLLNYQDVGTKFCFLRPLTSKQAADVAFELFKIFTDFGYPAILDSEYGKEFTGCIINELLNIWPDCKILNGKPSDTKDMRERGKYKSISVLLSLWMQKNKSTAWSRGCYFVQNQKNCTLNKVMKKSPYKALFGRDSCSGLAATNLQPAVISTLKTEEDLEEALQAHIKYENEKEAESSSNSS